MDLSKIKIIYKGKLIKQCSYEKLLNKTISNIYNSNVRNNFWIGVEKEELLIFLIIYYTLQKYKENLVDEENCISDYLEEESIVVHKGSRKVYMGKEEKNGCMYYKLKTKEDMVTFVPDELLYTITPYCGNATTINLGVYKGNQYLAKKFIADVFDLEISDLRGYINNKVLIVHENKQILNHVIENIVLEYKEQKYQFSSLFSCVYYGNPEKAVYYKGNKEKDEPLVLLTTNLEVGEKLVFDNKNIKDIVIIGGSLIKDRVEGIIRRLSKRKSVNKVLLIDEWFSRLSFNEILQSDLEFDIYAYSKSVILKNINLLDKRDFVKESQVTIETREKIDRFVENAFSCSIIEEDISISLFKLLNLIKPLKEIAYIKNQMFLIGCYSLLKIFKCLSIPLKYIPNMNNTIKSKIEELIDLTFDSNMTSEVYMEIIELFMDIHYYHLVNNKKYDKLKKIENKRYCKVITKYEEEAKYLCESNLLQATSAMDLNDNSCSNVAVTYYDENNINKVFESPFVKKFIYISKLDTYKYREFNTKKLNEAKKIRKRNILDGKYEEMEEILTDSVTIEENSILEDEEKNGTLKELLITNINAILTQNEEFIRQGVSNIEVEKTILFNDYFYALLSENYVADVVNYNSKTLCSKKTNELQIGDKLVFAKFSKNGKDAVDCIIDMLIKYGKIDVKQIEQIELNNLWKNKLLKYKDVNYLNYKELGKKLEMNAQNIYSWLESNVVAPRNGEDIKRICLFLNDIELISRVDEIVIASKATRQVRTKARKILEKLIINSTFESQEGKDEIIVYLEEKLGSLEDYVQILTIESIENCSTSISVNNANRPLLLLEE